MGLDVPVLFLIFNRPELTHQVFQTIRASRPARLYIAADGPRAEKAGEWKLCAETREVAKKIDWSCELKTLFRDDNLGCGQAVSEAIGWFFDHEEKGIILEDDCLPDASFYPFCGEMLDRFQDEDRVGSISGNNFLPPSLHASQPYLFSKYVQIWGWATWRRFWKFYDFDLKGEEEEWEKIIRRVNPVDKHARYWLEIFRALRSGLIDTWDYQVMFSAWKADLVHIYPSRNLMSNLGYGDHATHTNFESPVAQLATGSIENFQVTLPVVIDPMLDDATFYFRFLESLTNVWWLEQALDLTEKLAWSRWQINQAQKEVTQLKEVCDDQARQVAKIAATRSRAIYRTNLVLLLSHWVYTMREALTLARTRFNRMIGRRRLSDRGTSGTDTEEKKQLVSPEIERAGRVHPDR